MYQQVTVILLKKTILYGIKKAKSLVSANYRNLQVPHTLFLFLQVAGREQFSSVLFIVKPVSLVPQPPDIVQIPGSLAVPK